MSARLSLPPCPDLITDKVRIADQRMLYISVHGNSAIALHDVIAPLMSVVLKYDASLEKIGDLIIEAKSVPCGPVSGHDRLQHCSSLLDLIGPDPLVEYGGV